MVTGEGPPQLDSGQPMADTADDRSVGIHELLTKINFR
ncbi:hypothetical protein ABH994_001448 [Bradyrhizobium yuanmingense]